MSHVFPAACPDFLCPIHEGSHSKPITTEAKATFAMGFGEE